MQSAEVGSNTESFLLAITKMGKVTERKVAEIIVEYGVK